MRVFVLALSLLLPATMAWAQADERTVYASVVDKKDNPVTGLGASDFIVREDNLSREVLRVSPATEPAHIALLIDTSQAIGEQVNDIRAALREFFKQEAGKNEIALIGLGERPTILVDYTRSVEQLEKGLAGIYAHSGSGTYILEGIVTEADRLRTRKAARPHIIVYAAQGPEFSERHNQNVIDALREAGATLHAVPMNRKTIPMGDREEQELQMTFANGTRMSGGRREEILTPMSLSSRLQAVGKEIDGQYRIVYARPQKLIPPKAMEVTIKKPDLTVRAKRWP